MFVFSYDLGKVLVLEHGSPMCKLLSSLYTWLLL